MKEFHKIENSKSNIFARVRANNCGESQSFNSADAAFSWVYQVSRELVESGYSSVTFTIQGEYNRNEYQGHATSTQYDNRIQYEQTKHNLSEKNKTNKETKKIEEKRNNTTTDFFCMSESQIMEIAAATMEAAKNSKELSDSEFESAILDASMGIVSLRRHAGNHDQVDFRPWEAYTATHPSRDPGKKPLNAIEHTIIDTYMRAQTGVTCSKECVVTSTSKSLQAVDELIQNIIHAIHVHLREDEDVRAYLSCLGTSLETVISAHTGGVITCSISDTEVSLSSSTGVTCSVTIEGKAFDSIENELRAILIRMLFHVGLSHRTHDTIARIIDLEELSDMALTLGREEPKKNQITDSVSLSCPHKENNENVQACTSDTPPYSYSLL